MEQFITPQELRLFQPNYSGEKVNCILKSLRKVDIKKKMSSKRQNTVDELYNYFKIHNNLPNTGFKLAYKLWFNFVLMDYSNVE